MPECHINAAGEQGGLNFLEPFAQGMRRFRPCFAIDLCRRSMAAQILQDVGGSGNESLIVSRILQQTLDGDCDRVIGQGADTSLFDSSRTPA